MKAGVPASSALLCSVWFDLFCSCPFLLPNPSHTWSAPTCSFRVCSSTFLRFSALSYLFWLYCFGLFDLHVQAFCLSNHTLANPVHCFPCSTLNSLNIAWPGPGFVLPILCYENGPPLSSSALHSFVCVCVCVGWGETWLGWDWVTPLLAELWKVFTLQ